MSPGRKVLLGAALWIAAVLGVAAARASLDEPARARLAHVQSELRGALFSPAPTYTVFFEGGTTLERNNGVFASIDGKLVRIGEVIRVRRDQPLPHDLLATIAIDEQVGAYRPVAGTVGVRRSQGQSFLVAMRTLVPAARWQRIQSEWRNFRLLHQQEITRELQPLASELLRVAARAVADELPAALERHRAELDAVVVRMRAGLGKEQVQPLLVEDLWPIVVKHAAGPAEIIGRELWERVPLMSFAIRAAADRLLEEEPVRVEERWREFVRDEALPTLRAHDAEMEAAFGAIVKEVLASEAIHARLGAVWAAVRDDPAVRSLARTLTRELFAENARLESALRELAEAPETKARLERLGSEFQKFFDPIGELLLLDESRQGINPELAQLIRSLLLRRDSQVIHLELAPGSQGGAPLEPGAQLPGRHEP